MENILEQINEQIQICSNKIFQETSLLLELFSKLDNENKGLLRNQIEQIVLKNNTFIFNKIRFNDNLSKIQEIKNNIKFIKSKQLFLEKRKVLFEISNTEKDIKAKIYKQQIEQRIASNTQRFIKLLEQDTRQGIPQLISFLINKSDFLTAPASTKFHNCMKGGLLDHSLNVRDLLAEKNERFNLGIPEDTVNLTGLMHDLCKCNLYIPMTRKKPVLTNGQNKWIEYDGYSYDDKLPLGHGEKSVILLQRFVKLSTLEIMLIRWHMGFSDKDVNGMIVNNAYDLYPVITAIITADMEATRLLECSPFENKALPNRLNK